MLLGGGGGQLLEHHHPRMLSYQTVHTKEKHMELYSNNMELAIGNHADNATG